MQKCCLPLAGGCALANEASNPVVDAAGTWAHYCLPPITPGRISRTRKGAGGLRRAHLPSPNQLLRAGARGHGCAYLFHSSSVSQNS